MVNKNDEMIMRLKERIEEKRAAIGPELRFSPVTKCILNLDGNTYNLNVVSEEGMVFLACKVWALRKAAEDLRENLVIDGYSIEDWWTDIAAKRSVAIQKKELAELKAMEKKLDKMLSDDKKIELELAEFEAMLR